MDALTRYSQLCDQVDSFFRRVHETHTAHMDCGRGCADCCQVRLSVTLVEAVAIAAYLQGLGEGERAAISAFAAAPTQACSALDEAGQCRIYPARPLVCRSHGVPVQVNTDDRTRLPVLDVCPRNFTAEGVLDAVPESDVLNQRTVSTVLAAIDAALADALGADRGTRVDLAELLIDPNAMFEME